MRLSVGSALLCFALGVMNLNLASASDPARPSESELRAAVQSLLGPKQDPKHCRIVPRAKDYSIECRNTECKACNVTHAITILTRKAGKWRIAETRRERRGDTGECGCCM